MSRNSNQDFLQNCNFHASAAGPAGTPDAETDFLHPEKSADGTEAGFSQITMPEVSTDAAEYREGHRTWTQKFPGIPTVSDSTFNQGVTLFGTGFYGWVVQRLFEGLGEFRSDLTIWQFPRQLRTASGFLDLSKKDKAKKTLLFNCFPLRVKPSGDLDATGTDVSLSEMDVSVEYLHLEVPKA